MQGPGPSPLPAHANYITLTRLTRLALRSRLSAADPQLSEPPGLPCFIVSNRVKQRRLLCVHVRMCTYKWNVPPFSLFVEVLTLRLCQDTGHVDPVQSEPWETTRVLWGTRPTGLDLGKVRLSDGPCFINKSSKKFIQIIICHLAIKTRCVTELVSFTKDVNVQMFLPADFCFFRKKTFQFWQVCWNLFKLLLLFNQVVFTVVQLCDY